MLALFLQHRKTMGKGAIGLLKVKARPDSGSGKKQPRRYSLQRNAEPLSRGQFDITTASTQRNWRLGMIM